MLSSERRSGVGRQLIRHVVERALEDRQRQRQQQQTAKACNSNHISGQQRTAGTETDERVRVYDEWTPFCYTNESNAASKGLFESLGFETNFQIDWITWKPTVRYRSANNN